MRNLKNEKNPMWKGDNVGFKCLHKWVYRHKGRPGNCLFCGESNKKRVWANKSREYKRDLEDWIPLCYSCHYKYDEQSWWKQSIRGRVPWNKDIPWSDEVKEKIGKSRKGKLWTEESKQKIKGRHNSIFTEFKKGHIPTHGFKKGNVPWNKKLDGFRVYIKQ